MSNSTVPFPAVTETPDGHQHGEFEAVLSQLDGASPDPETMAFWRTQPEAYAAATKNPQPPGAVMKRFVDWVRSLAGDAIFAAHPLTLDGP